MKINKFDILTPAHWELLLDADPAEKLVKEYTSRMNLAVAKNFRGKKLAQTLLHYVLDWSKQSGFRRVEIGTGSTGVQQLYLYQKCGFRMTHIEHDFFLHHYEEEIIENGLVLKDMVRLAQDLF